MRPEVHLAAILCIFLCAVGCQSTLDDVSIKDIYGPAGRTARNLVDDQKARARRQPLEGSPEFDAAKDLYEQQKYSEALPAFKALVKKYKDKPIEEDAQFMVAESLFQLDRYPAAQDAYEELLKKYPATRYLESSTRRLFSIASYWLKSPKPASEVELAHFAKEGPDEQAAQLADAAVPLQIPIAPNFFDGSRPVFDTEGRALEALRQVWINDPSGPLADDALMMTATHHLRKKDFREADRYFSNIRQQYSTSEHAASAYVLGSYASQMSYQGPNYDGRQLDEARKLTESAVRLFEDLPQRPKLLEDLERLETQAAERDWQKVEYFMKRREKGAAAVYCECIVESYPQSPYAAKARDLLAQLGPEYAAGILKSSPARAAARPQPERTSVQPQSIEEPEELAAEPEAEPLAPGRASMRRGRRAAEEP